MSFILLRLISWSWKLGIFPQILNSRWRSPSFRRWKFHKIPSTRFKSLGRSLPDICRWTQSVNYIKKRSFFKSLLSLRNLSIIGLSRLIFILPARWSSGNRQPTSLSSSAKTKQAQMFYWRCLSQNLQVEISSFIILLKISNFQAMFWDEATYHQLWCYLSFQSSVVWPLMMHIKPKSTIKGLRVIYLLLREIMCFWLTEAARWEVSELKKPSRHWEFSWKVCQRIATSMWSVSDQITKWCSIQAKDIRSNPLQRRSNWWKWWTPITEAPKFTTRSPIFLTKRLTKAIPNIFSSWLMVMSVILIQFLLLSKNYQNILGFMRLGLEMEHRLEL